jgi:Flp pilus assembly protein TadD
VTRSRTVLAVIALLTIAAYWPAVQSPLLFDDTTAITHNATIQTLDPVIALHPPTDGPTAGRPLANYSFAMNVAVDQIAETSAEAPGGTLGFHLVNIALHLAAGLLLFGVFRRTLRAGPDCNRWKDGGDGIALVVTAIWLLHPLQTEAVNYLTQRTELLVSLCYLATLYASIRAWDAANSRTRTSWYFAAIISCLLGVASKEVIATLPLIIVLYDIALRAERLRDLRQRRWFYLALFATLAPLALLVRGTARAAATVHTGMTWSAYFISQGWALLHYLRLVLWPAPLAIDYGWLPIPLTAALPGLILLTLAAAATIVLWRQGGRRRRFAFAGAWFFLILGPSSSLIPIAGEVAAERRVYLALAAVIACVVLAIDRLTRDSRWESATGAGGGAPSLRRALPAVIIPLLAALTFGRSMEYRHPEQLWRDAIAVRPDNPRAWNNLGSALADATPASPAAADSAYRQSVALDSTYTPALYNLATSDVARHELPEAERLLGRVVTAVPDDGAAWLELGGVLLLRGNVDSAAASLQRAVAITPGNASALASLGLAEGARHKDATAAALYRRALLIDPGNATAQAGLARLPPELR